MLSHGYFAMSNYESMDGWFKRHNRQMLTFGYCRQEGPPQTAEAIMNLISAYQFQGIHIYIISIYVYIYRSISNVQIGSTN